MSDQTDLDLDLDTRVCVVDDDEELADTYSIWLEQDGYDVLTAYSGEEALAALDTDVDVILLDRRMPDMPGDVVLEEARQRPGSYQISMLTAVEPRERILELPFDEYLTKPVTKSDVVETVEQLAHRDSLERELQELFRLSAKRSALENESSKDLEGAQSSLEREIDSMQRSIQERIQELDEPDSLWTVVDHAN